MVLKIGLKNYYKLCLNCSKSILIIRCGEHRKFCSNNCGSHYRRNFGISNRGEYILINCEVCNNPFYINSNAKRWATPNSKYRFCSHKCATIGLIVTNYGKKIRSRRKRIICKNCRKPFFVSMCQIRKYCKRSCYYEHRRNRNK